MKSVAKHKPDAPAKGRASPSLARQARAELRSFVFRSSEAHQGNIILLSPTRSVLFQDLDDAVTEQLRGMDPFRQSRANRLLLDQIVLLIQLIGDPVAVEQHAIARLELNLVRAVRV